MNFHRCYSYRGLEEEQHHDQGKREACKLNALPHPAGNALIIRINKHFPRLPRSLMGHNEGTRLASHTEKVTRGQSKSLRPFCKGFKLNIE